MFRLMLYFLDMISFLGERNFLDRDGRLRGVEVLMGLVVLNLIGVEVNRGLLVWEGWIYFLGELWLYGESFFKFFIFLFFVVVLFLLNMNICDVELYMMLFDFM